MSYIKKLIASSAVGLGGAVMITASAGALSGSGTVTTDDIVNGAVTSAKIATNTIKSQDLAKNSVGSSELQDNAVGSSNIKTHAVKNDNIDLGAVTGDRIASDTNIGLSDTVATGTTGSHQTIGGDMNYEGNAGGTSNYHAGVMGNFLGDTLTNTTSSYHAGVIGSYNVTTSDANTGAQAGVVGEVGDGAVASGTSAVMAVLGGDSGALTPDSAYGVQYFNSTAGSHFNYGLDLYHAATADYTSVSAVDYGVADIRLASGATISSGSSNPATCVKGSINLNTSDGKLYVCSDSSNTWTVAGSQS